MSDNIKKSRFLIPYKNEGGKSVLSNRENWESMNFYGKYLTDNINMLFQKEKGEVCLFWRLKKSSYISYGLKDDSISIMYKRSENTEHQKYTFKINDIFEAQFITGINILVLDIEYDADEELKNIANMSFIISHLDLKGGRGKDSLVSTSELPEDCTVVFEQKNTQNDECRTIIFTDIIKKIILDGKLEEKVDVIGRIIAYHNLVIEQECTTDNCMLFFLRRCREYIDNNEYLCSYDEAECKCEHCQDAHCQCSYEQEIEFKYENSQNIVLSGCSKGVVSLAKNNSFVKNGHVNNVYNDYFLLFLYVVHEREVLLRYSKEIIGSYNNDKKMYMLKDQMMKFNVLFGFNIASQEMAYQKFYENLHKAFRLEILEKEVQDILNKLTEFQEKKRKKRTGRILWIISIISILSAIKTIAEFVKLIPNVNTEMSYAISIAIVIIAAVVGYISVRVGDKKDDIRK